MSFIPSVGSLALDAGQAYGFTADGAIPGDGGDTPLTTTSNVYAAPAGDITPPAATSSAVSTVNETGLYQFFIDYTWTTQASSTGWRQFLLQDGDGNTMWGSKQLAANLPAGMQHSDGRLLWLPRGLQLTAVGIQNGGSSESLHSNWAFYRLA